MKDNKKIKSYISLFSGAGIGCYGFKKNGFECIATNEIIHRRLEIQKFNNKCRYQSGYIFDDISKEETKQRIFTELSLWKRKHKVKDLDVIIATPPCQGMSVANHKKKNELKRNSLVVESIYMTKNILPKIFIFENVRSFLNTICTDIDNKSITINEAIGKHLDPNYHILSKVCNLKNYGSNSSRTRTIVIGVRKDLKNISPFDLFPDKKKPKNLKHLIGDLKSLKDMGEIDSNDIYHSFREFDRRMIPWIELLDEGQSAFDNNSKERIPHRVINGEIVFNKSSNADKYRRCFWNQIGPCIHTRNDILASQSTIHPSDNRVFSIRELMRMMTIPKNFKWHSRSFKELSSLSLLEKKKLLKKSDSNIRQCIGEAVPTYPMTDISSKINNYLTNADQLTLSKVKKIILDYDLGNIDNILLFINENQKKYSINELFFICEIANAKRLENAAFFTRSDIVYSIIKDLPKFSKKKILKILEPSVGVGNFLPQIIEKYKDVKSIEIDVYDIDINSIKILSSLLKIINPPSNFKINIINQDFLLSNTSKKYDLVVGNPPFKKIVGNKELLSLYRLNAINKESKNIFSFFLDKSINLGRYVSLIMPKSLTHTPEFDKTRDMLNSYNLLKICDYGEKGFNGVKIETISILLEVKKEKSDNILIESFIRNSQKFEMKNYIFSKNFPYWIIYRDKKFDKTLSKMQNGTFDFKRDRQITKKITKKSGKFRVLKSRNIGNNKIIDNKKSDCYVDSIDNLSISKFMNSGAVLIPNLTYYPRGCFLPKNVIADGSVALLFVKRGVRKPNKKDLDFYGTEEFEYYYRVARNFGTRSLNIDNNSIFFFGLLKN